MNSAKKMTQTPAISAEAMVLEVTHLSVKILKPPSFDAGCRMRVDWKLPSLSASTTIPELQTYLSKAAVGKGTSEEDEDEDIKGSDRVGEVVVGRGVGVEKTVLLITEL